MLLRANIKYETVRNKPKKPVGLWKP